jgi:hypothetical protein
MLSRASNIESIVQRSTFTVLKIISINHTGSALKLKMASLKKAPTLRIEETINQPLNSLTSGSFLIPSNSFGSPTTGSSCTLGGTIGFPPFTLSSFFTGSAKLSLHCDLFSASSSPAVGFFPRFRRKHQIDRVRRASTAATTPALMPALTPILMLFVESEVEFVFDEEEAVPERSCLG